ncbi:MAG: FAD-binding oxidoreductase [Proteobacteria bacterium]|nr:FAD-binding oxidoreductase [Pseudomonadota bacterium]MDA1059979.1 FAD-binding oxidoreductase [Pseudomonadota bacterium]
MSAEIELHALNAMSDVVGSEHVRRDSESCRYFSSDLFFEPPVLPIAVVSPATRDDVVRIVQIASNENVSIVPRGGGLSYTGGYLSQGPRCIILDTTRLTRIIEINDDDQYVTVEAGVTWQMLDEVVAQHGLRVPHFGPATGRVSTIGGGLSQNTVLFGSAQYGSAADHVLSLEVALADGSRVKTGSGAIRGGEPFFRYHGPDLTGLFLGDCGALGVKLSATLQLMPRPPSIDFASFAFPTFEAMIAAETEIGRSRLATDLLGAGNYVPPDGDAAEAKPAMHLVVEGYSARDVSERLDRLRQIAGHQGKEVEPTVPRFLRDRPFNFLTSLLSDDGRMQAWTHGIVPFSQALHVFGAITAFFNAKAALIARCCIDITISTGVMGRGVLLEPVIRWRDQPRAIHLGGLGGAPEAWAGTPDEAATTAAMQLRRGLRDLFRRECAAHLQIGKFYAYRDGLTEETDDMVRRLKHALDPQGRMNPGALGLG